MRLFSTPRPLLPRTAFCLCAVLAVAAAGADSTESPASRPPAHGYILTTGDALTLEFFGEPDLKTSATIDRNGQVRLPLVEKVTLAGLTVADAQTAVEVAYREGEFIAKCHVTIRIDGFSVKEVMISGQVRSPGRYPVPAHGTMTVIDLIVKAGGLTDLARGNAISLIRTTADGKRTTRTVEAAKLLKGEGDSKAPELALSEGDLVFVPERLF